MQGRQPFIGRGPSLTAQVLGGPGFLAQLFTTSCAHFTNRIVVQDKAIIESSAHFTENSNKN